MEQFNSPLQPRDYRTGYPFVSRLGRSQPRDQPDLLGAYASTSRHTGHGQLSAPSMPSLGDEDDDTLELGHFGCRGLDFSFLDELEPGTPPVSSISFRSIPGLSAPPVQSYNNTTQPISTTKPLDSAENPSSFQNTSPSYFHSPHNAISIDEKAADLCYRWLIHFSPCWPEEKDFEAFERLTGESVTRIKNWFGQRLSQPLHPIQQSTANHHLALPSPPASTASISRTSSSQGIALPTRRPSSSTLELPSPSSPATSPFRPQPRRCTPTTTRADLAHEPARPFQCTRACGRSFPRKGEWAKHELKNHPQRVWLCLHGAVVVVHNHHHHHHHHHPSSHPLHPPSCAYCPHPNPSSAHLVAAHWSDGDERWCARQFGRKDHLAVHLRAVHDVDAQEAGWYAEAGRLEVGEELGGWERWCGFCRRTGCWRGWRERVDHLGRHFKREGRGMEGWGEWPGEGEGVG
ncbi:hypothetical protein GTA08_BOTSDO07735 [Botryosphaeria dothidea]|uniref:C2H2-type domain-containing protein n=1 Tax=Botryosphaeria dothidea TaxID=55169 RepID=A0A8H4IQW4_9PEZI|nr:hypothetical protein GTA08_BOTSDO07735 [Botryosphaeria dothidea]